MKRSATILGIIGVIAGFYFWPPAPEPAKENYEVVFATYLGGRNWEHARDVAIDSEGNIVVVGGTSSRDFPTTEGVFDRTYNKGGKALGDGGDCDVFVTKYSPEGQLLWSTLIGGPNYDRAYAVEIEPNGVICLAGRAGEEFPTTKDAFQPEFRGAKTVGRYGTQCAFAAKLSADGTKLLWASYVGVSNLARDMDIDSEGNMILPFGRGHDSPRSSFPKWFGAAFKNGFQKDLKGHDDFGVVKIAKDGKKVLWATWLAGSGEDCQGGCLRIAPDGDVWILTNTKSDDMPTTKGAFQPRRGGDWDGYLARLSPDGSKLLMGTYIGGKGEEWAVNTHNLALGPEGAAYVSTHTASSDFPTTEGSYSQTRKGKADMAVLKIAAHGKLLASTLLGGRGEEGPDGISVDQNGCVLVSGESNSPYFPRTENAAQLKSGGGSDGFLLRLSADLREVIYGTFWGGTGFDNVRSCVLGKDGDLYGVGASNSRDFPTKKAAQKKFAGGKGPYGNGDVIVIRLRPIP